MSEKDIQKIQDKIACCKQEIKDLQKKIDLYDFLQNIEEGIPQKLIDNKSQLKTKKKELEEQLNELIDQKQSLCQDLEEDMSEFTKTDYSFFITNYMAFNNKFANKDESDQKDSK